MCEVLREGYFLNKIKKKLWIFINFLFVYVFNFKLFKMMD